MGFMCSSAVCQFVNLFISIIKVSMEFNLNMRLRKF